MLLRHLIIPGLFTLLLLSCQSLWFDDEGIPETDELSTYDRFYEEVDQHYSFFPLLQGDFDSAYLSARLLVEQEPNLQGLTAALQELVIFLEDGHTNVYPPGIPISYDGWFANSPINQLESISIYFSRYVEVNGALDYGLLRDRNLGYVRIKTFSNAVPTASYMQIDAILNELANTDGLIIDVRSNGGGSSNNAELLISRFNDEPRLIFRSRVRLPAGRDQFSAWQDVFTPAPHSSTYQKPTAVLSNRLSYSATEWFIAGMHTIPHVTHIGDTTGGGSGTPRARVLPNGWTMRVSNSQRELPEGRDFQFTGIYPDIPVWINPGDSIRNRDSILERAISRLE